MKESKTLANAGARVEAPTGKRTVSIKGRGKLSVARERARAPRALACGIGGRCLRAHRRVGGGIASPGMRARQLRVCLCVCVTLMDAPMERRTDAWADLTACSGGAPHTFAAGLGRKHLRSAETKRSPESFSEPGEGRENELPRGSRRGATRHEGLRSSGSQRIRRREPLLRLLTSVRVEAQQQQHIWRTRRRRERERRLWGTHLRCSPRFFSLVLPCSYHSFSLRSSEKSTDCFKNKPNNFTEVENFFSPSCEVDENSRQKAQQPRSE